MVQNEMDRQWIRDNNLVPKNILVKSKTFQQVRYKSERKSKRGKQLEAISQKGEGFEVLGLPHELFILEHGRHMKLSYKIVFKKD